MTEHEDMLRWWTITLIQVLQGFTMATMQMELVGEGKRAVELWTEDILDTMSAYTPEGKRLLARQFELLSGLAVRVEPSS